MAAETKTGTVRITLVKSLIGQKYDQVATAKALGLRRINSSVEKANDPVIRGMIFKIKHLIAVEEVA
jgi:large subunit ribosomal protein L30